MHACALSFNTHTRTRAHTHTHLKEDCSECDLGFALEPAGPGQQTCSFKETTSVSITTTTFSTTRTTSTTTTTTTGKLSLTNTASGVVTIPKGDKIEEHLPKFTASGGGKGKKSPSYVWSSHEVGGLTWVEVDGGKSYLLLGKPTSPPGTLIQIQVTVFEKEAGITASMSVTVALGYKGPIIENSKGHTDGDTVVCDANAEIKSCLGTFSVFEGSGKFQLSGALEDALPRGTRWKENEEQKLYWLEGELTEQPGTMVATTIILTDTVTSETLLWTMKIKTKDVDLTLLNTKGVKNGDTITVANDQLIESVLGKFRVTGGSKLFAWVGTTGVGMIPKDSKWVSSEQQGDASGFNQFTLQGLMKDRPGTVRTVTVTVIDRVTSASKTMQIKIQAKPAELFLINSDTNVVNGSEVIIEEGAKIDDVLQEFVASGGSGLFMWLASASPSPLKPMTPRDSPTGGSWIATGEGSSNYVLRGSLEEFPGTRVTVVVIVTDIVTARTLCYTLTIVSKEASCQNEIEAKNAELADCVVDRKTGYHCIATCKAGFIGNPQGYRCDGSTRKMIPVQTEIKCVQHVCKVPTRFNSGLDRFAILKSPCDDIVAGGTRTCNAMCLEGFEEISSTEFVCQLDGTWVGTIHCVPRMIFRTADGAYFEGPAMLKPGKVEYNGGPLTGFRMTPSGAWSSYKVNKTEIDSTSVGVEIRSVNTSGVVQGRNATVAWMSFDTSADKLVINSKTYAEVEAKAGDKTSTVRLGSKLDEVVSPFSVIGGSGRYIWRGLGAPAVNNKFQFSPGIPAIDTVAGTDIGTGVNGWQERADICFEPTSCPGLRVSDTLGGKTGKSYKLGAVVIDQLFGLTAALEITIESAEFIQAEVVLDNPSLGYKATENGEFKATLTAVGISNELPRRCTVIELSDMDGLFNEYENARDFPNTAKTWGYTGLPPGLSLNEQSCVISGRLLEYFRDGDDDLKLPRIRRVSFLIEVLTLDRTKVFTVEETIDGVVTDVKQTTSIKFDFQIYPKVIVEVDRTGFPRANIDDPRSAELIDVGEDFSAIISITGGIPPYTFDPDLTVLPQGLNVGQVYLITGKPSKPTSTETRDGKAIVVEKEFFVAFTDAFGAAEKSEGLPYKIGTPDCDDETNGPGGSGCFATFGTCIDTPDGDDAKISGRFDNSFTCSCNSDYSGPNCAEPPFDPLPATIGGVGGFLGLIVIIGVIYVLYQRHLLNQPHDFDAEIAKLIAQGLISGTSTDGGRRVPKELKRESVIMIERLGAGAFGDVNKGLYDPQEPGMPEYPVAIKVLKEGAGREEIEDLMKEATVTAQFVNEHVVMLVGVVTSGEPHMLVLQLCEKGALNSMLKASRIENSIKLKYCFHIAKGMEYLNGLGFVHRDLAARNVLVDAKDFAKIADFGLSRDTEDDQYYVAKAGKVPIRWTAPEALTMRKFSEFSDVWAYGITCVEIWQNGETPYKGWMNAFVMEQVLDGYKLPCPTECPPRFYNRIISRALEFETKSRAKFNSLSVAAESLITDEACLNVTGYGVDDADDAVEELEEEVEFETDCLIFESQKHRAAYCRFCYYRAGTGPHRDVSGGEIDEASYDQLVISREKVKCKWFHGVIGEDEAQKRLKSRRGTGDEMTQTFIERKTYLLREIDKFTFALSVLTNGRYGHHVLELCDDMSIRERDDDRNLGKSLSKAGRGIITSVGLATALPVSRPRGSLDRQGATTNGAYVHVSHEWWSGKLDKSAVSNAVLQGGPGSYMVRPSSVEGSVVICINDNMQVVSFQVMLSSDKQTATFSGKTLAGGIEGLLQFLRENPLESKKGGANVKLTFPAPGGILSPWHDPNTLPQKQALKRRSSSAGSIKGRTDSSIHGKWWAGQMTKEEVTTAVKTAGPGTYMIRPSSLPTQIVLVVNDFGVVVNFPIKISPSETEFVFAGRTHSCPEALVHWYCCHRLQSKYGGPDYYLTASTGVGSNSPFGASEGWAPPPKGGAMRKKSSKKAAARAFKKANKAEVSKSQTIDFDAPDVIGGEQNYINDTIIQNHRVSQKSQKEKPPAQSNVDSNFPDTIGGELDYINDSVVDQNRANQKKISLVQLNPAFESSDAVTEVGFGNGADPVSLTDSFFFGNDSSDAGIQNDAETTFGFNTKGYLEVEGALEEDYEDADER